MPRLRPICLHDVDRENFFFTSDSFVLNIRDGQEAKQSHSLEVNASLSSRQIALIYTNVLCSHQPATVPIQSHMSPIHAIQSCLIITPYTLGIEVYSGFSHRNPVCIYLFPYTCHVACQYHYPWFDHANHLWWEIIKLLVQLSYFNIFNVLLSNTLYLCSCLSMRDQASCPYKTAGIMFWSVSSYITKKKTKDSGPNR